MNTLELGTYTKINKALRKKAMENKIPLVTLAMADTYDQGTIEHIHGGKQDWFDKEPEKYEKILIKSNGYFQETTRKHKTCKISMIKVRRKGRMDELFPTG